MNKKLIMGFCLGILLLILGTGLLIYYSARQLARGTFIFGISRELLANPPIASEPGIADRIEHGIDPLSMLSDEPTGAGNAATYYVEVMRSLAAREPEGARDISPLASPTLTEDEFQAFMEGVRQGRCDFSTESLVLDGKPVRLGPTVNISDSLGHIFWFRRIARAVIERGSRREAEGKLESALKRYEATLKFGYDIEKGRESVIQVFVGVAVQKMAAEKLNTFHERRGNGEEVRRWGEFLLDLDGFISKYRGKTKKLTETFGFSPEAVANALWILEHDEDPLFRREVMTTLGISRAFVPDLVEPVLEETAHNDPDPYVREAAQNALLLVGGHLKSAEMPNRQP